MRTLREFRAALKSALAGHELRHRPSRFGIALFDSIHYVPASAWDDLTDVDHVFQSRAYLAALEAAGAEGLQMRYALMYDGQRPVGAVIVQLHDFAGDAVGSHAAAQKGVRKNVGKVLRRATDRVQMRLLMCGNAFVTGEHGFAFAPDVPPEDAFDGLAEVIYRIRRADKLSGQVTGVLVKDFYDQSRQSTGAKRLRAYGYRAFEVDPQMVVVIEPAWTTFDDYVAAMTKKYRARVRSVRKKGKALRREPFDLAAMELHRERIDELFDAVHQKAKFRIASLPPDYFPSLAEGLGPRFAMHGYFLEDVLVGFTTTIGWGARMEGHYLGLDYEHNKAHAIYQNILFDSVAEAIEHGCRELFLGRTALEIKSSIGATARPVTCYMRHRNPASNALARPMFRFIKPTSWAPRNPFGDPMA